jgi:hypothetical protein
VLLEAQWGNDRQEIVRDDQQRLDSSAENFKPFVHDTVGIVHPEEHLALPGGGAVHRPAYVERHETGVELFVYPRGGLTRLADPWYASGGSSDTNPDPLHTSFRVEYTDSPRVTLPARCTWQENNQGKGGDLRLVRDHMVLRLWFVIQREGRILPCLVTEPFTLFSVARFDPPARYRSHLGLRYLGSYGVCLPGNIPPQEFPDRYDMFQRTRLNRMARSISIGLPTSGDPQPVTEGDTSNDVLRQQMLRHPCGVSVVRRMDDFQAILSTLRRR